jgi:hypothetical protein
MKSSAVRQRAMFTNWNSAFGDGLVQGGTDVARLRLQVVTGLLPGDDEFLRVRAGNLEGIDQGNWLRHDSSRLTAPVIWRT